MKKKDNSKMKWYILIAVALLVGAIIGYFATNSLTTAGNSNIVFKQQKNIENNENTIYLDGTISKKGCKILKNCKINNYGYCVCKSFNRISVYEIVD